MERIIVACLNYFLEHINPLKGYQTGFRRCKSTSALVKVCSEIEKSFIMKEVMVAVFLDIEKAYDTMWKEGLLIKLGKLGINGKMYNYILDFLSQRSIRVKMGDTVFDEFIVENGIPRGSAVSPILFNIMINDIYEKLGEIKEGLLHADDESAADSVANVTTTTQATDEVHPWLYLHDLFSDIGVKDSFYRMKYLLYLPRVTEILAFKNSLSNLKKHIEVKYY